MACGYCEIAEGKRKVPTVYEDDIASAFLSMQPATIGHIVIIPKRHAPIIEVLGNDDIEHIFSIANRMSVALFESVKCEGTNIIIQNGIAAGQEEPHFSVNILARKTGDGLAFEWVPKQLGDEEMATVEIQMKEGLARAEERAEKKPEQPEKAKEEKKAEMPAEKKDTTARTEDAAKTEEKEKPAEEESYLIKQLRRVP